MQSLGLIVTGDYALATGADRHVAYAARLLARVDRSLVWAWMVPADRVQLAASLFEALQRPHPVACFGGLGDGIDDHVKATVAALQSGRDAVGLARYSEQSGVGAPECGNIAFFGGNPERSHAAFEQWLTARVKFEALNDAPVAAERIRWDLPESAVAAGARRITRREFPTVIQRLVAAPEGSVALVLEGPSRGKTQAARKLLQRELQRH